MKDDEKQNGLGVLKNLAKNVGDASKSAAISAKDSLVAGWGKAGEQLIQLKKEHDLKKLSPVFKEDILDENYKFPAIIQLIRYDKRLEKDFCKGSVGFETRANSTRILSVYFEYADIVEKDFYPQKDIGVYYANPCIKDMYIEINEFFPYLKRVRVDELDMLAQSLGAKHFKVELKETESDQSVVDADTSSGFGFGKWKLDSGAALKAENSAKVHVNIAAECSFCGSDQPKEPKLQYFKDDSNIMALIAMRMNPETSNSLVSKTYSIQYGKMTGIKTEQTADIDSALKLIKCAAAEKFAKTACRENCTILQYTIDF